MTCMQYKKLQKKKAEKRKEDLKAKADYLRSLGFDVYEPAEVYAILDKELNKSSGAETKTDVAVRSIGF